MSNPAVFLLAETSIQGKSIRIEDNLGEAIHIHIGEFRFSISIAEFRDIAQRILEGANEILKTNDLRLDMFDISSLDWGWLANYSSIKSMSLKNIFLRDLYTKGDVQECPGVAQIVPLKESRQLKALRGQGEELAAYREQNMYGQTNESRLQGVLDKIKKESYPYDNKLIMINQYGQIYDGDNRAACLMYLYGEDKEIPVIEIYFEGEPTLEEQREVEQQCIKYYRESKDESLSKKQWSEEINILEISLEDFLYKLSWYDFKYFLINQPLKNERNEKVADKVVIIESGKMIELCNCFRISYFGGNFYRFYKFLYSMQRGVYVRLEDIEIMLFDRLCCKSKFQEAFLPLDKKVQDISWNEVIFDKDKNIFIAGKNTEMIYVITNALFNKNKFEEEDKVFIQRNIDLIKNEYFKKLLLTILFGYTEEFLQLVLAGDFENANDHYLKNTKY